MKWTYSIKGKITAAILLAVILGLTMLTNLMERNRFKQLEASISSIYKDRLLVEGYIFHLYEDLKMERDQLQALEDHPLDVPTQRAVEQYRADRDHLIASYEETYLTEEEEINFNQLKASLAIINRLEDEILHSSNPAISPELIDTYDASTEAAFATLSVLSDIQTKEGASLKKESEKIIHGSVFTSHFELIVLFIIAFVIQALIFSSKTMRVGGQRQNAQLN